MALTPTLKVDDFSSTEALTNKVFEGKPVYSKVFTGTTGSSSDYEVGTVSDSMADLVNVYGYVKSSNTYIPVGYYNAAVNQFFCALIYSSKVLGLRYTASSFANCPFKITVEYTKS